LQSLHLDGFSADNVSGVSSSGESGKLATAFPLASAMVRAPLMQLSPMLIRLLSELSLPSSKIFEDEK